MDPELTQLRRPPPPSRRPVRMDRESDAPAMSTFSGTRLPNTPKPLRRKIPPPVPPRFQLPEPPQIPLPEPPPVQLEPRGPARPSPPPRAAIRPIDYEPYYANFTFPTTNPYLQPSPSQPVKPPIAPKPRSSMATSAGCAQPRYYGRDEAINVVMEDITNMDTAADDSTSPSSNSSSSANHVLPMMSVAPVPKPRSANSTRSTPDSDDHSLMQLPPPNVEDLDVPFQTVREPPLLERIVRSHPIWYLRKNMSREVAAHLLSNAPPGSFIVRPSSKPRCAAISVRVLQSAAQVTNHFVIEQLGSQRVRMLGSRIAFPSLPTLIEYYHCHGDEIQCLLRLPQVILDAKTTEQLIQIGNIGSAFWNWNNVPVISHHVSTFRPMIDEATTSFIGQNALPVGPQHKRSNSQNTSIETGSLARKAWQRTSDHRPHYYDSREWNRSGNMNLSREVSFAGHTSRRDTADDQNGRASRRSQSVRDSKQREGGRKKSFFKSIFGGQKEQKKRAGTPDLAHCTAFKVDQEAIKRSYGSAFEIGDPGVKSSNSTKPHNHENGVVTMRSFQRHKGEISNIGRPLPPKPGETDIVNAASALRLARHNEGSPGPPKSPEARKAMRPPGPAMDPQSKQSCLEELRRKRLQTQHEMLNASPSITSSPKLGLRPSEKFCRIPLGLKSPKKDHRLSVPDLLDLPQPTLAQESGRALREKLGRNEIGELGAINEGLITPVVRRKAFPIHYEIPQDHNKSSTSVSTTDGSDHYGDNKSRGSEHVYGSISSEAARSLGHPSPSVYRKESELIWRRNSAKRSPTVPEPPAPKTNRSGCIFPDRAGGAWSAVTSELNARQQAVKRRSGQIMSLDQTIVPSMVNAKMSEPGPSEYTPLSDLAADREHSANEAENQDDDTISVAGTVFNEPWDSTTWDNLLDLAEHKDRGSRRPIEPLVEDQENEHDSPTKSNKSATGTIKSTNWDSNSKYSTLDSRRVPLGTMKRADGPQSYVQSMMSLPRCQSRFSQCQPSPSFDDLTSIVPCLSPFSQCTNTNKEIAESGRIIQDYIEQLAEDPNTYTYKTISVFIECTKQSHEFEPTVVIRNVRQFMNGLKNFFIKQGEGELHAIFIEQRNRLTANQILNFDVIAENILQRLILKKLQPHLYRVKIDLLATDGYIDAVNKNIHFARELTLEQLGFTNAAELNVPTPELMDEIKNIFKHMQLHYSPQKKVEAMLKIIGAVLKTQRAASPDMENNPKQPHLDAIVRWFVYILSRVTTVTSEVEVWYMMELLPKQILEQGDVYYYLTAMQSAVHLMSNRDLLRNLKQKEEDLDHMATLPRVKPPPSATDLFVKIAIPDIIQGNIRYFTFPVLPCVPSVKFCRVVAHQLGITNPDCYGLYIIMDGYPTAVQPHECPDAIRDKLNATGKSFFFAYQPHGSKIAWPGEKIQGDPFQGLYIC